MCHPLCSFNIFQSFKNTKFIFSLWAIHKQMVGQIQVVSNYLLTSVSDNMYTLKNCRNELLQPNENLQLKLTDEHSKE